MSLVAQISAALQAVGAAIKGKQSTLVSGTNIKTINGNNLLGSGGITVGDVTTTGTQTLTNKTLTGYTETVATLTGSTPSIDPANGTAQTWTMTGNSAPTANIAAGQSVTLLITPSSYTITWPTMTWLKVGGGGVAPTLHSTGKTIVTLWKIGTTLYGQHAGDC